MKIMQSVTQPLILGVPMQSTFLNILWHKMGEKGYTVHQITLCAYGVEFSMKFEWLTKVLGVFGGVALLAYGNSYIDFNEHQEVFCVCRF